MSALQNPCTRPIDLFEVVTSEASYLRSLRLLTDTFVLSQALRDTLTPRDHHTLFSNVQRVQGVSLGGKALDLCDVVHAHAVGPFSVYVDYVRNQQYQEETYSRLMDTNVRFSAELRRLQSLPKCQRLPLPSFLLLPFQRITRLRMLLQVLLLQPPGPPHPPATPSFLPVSCLLQKTPWGPSPEPSESSTLLPHPSPRKPLPNSPGGSPGPIVIPSLYSCQIRHAALARSLPYPRPPSLLPRYHL
uniref:DH domain-containing protein n=1 Tax=Sus scrofa TaxID=9823 RepID=A0A8D0T543_PIG